MSIRKQINPEFLSGLDTVLDFTGPGGFNAIADLAMRRAKLGDLLSLGEFDPISLGVAITEVLTTGHRLVPDLIVRIYRRLDAVGIAPCIFFMHGGGMVMNSAKDEDFTASSLATEVRATVISVEYRLAPEHPYPAAMEDCYAALQWVVKNAQELAIDPDRIAVHGQSAGGGLAAGLALLARDRNGPSLAFQSLIYPMLDDRHQTYSSQKIVDIGIWDRAGSIEAWRWYLNNQDGLIEPEIYAAPARATDLSGLPPTFIDSGALDIFCDESISYASALLHANVPTELHIYPGAYHAFELFAPEADLSQQALHTRFAALRRGLRVLC